ncbi:MAG: hypothetical protein DPW09_05130 [Anaerolineae bacterium]|nr:hypothetical protein [Anaerolineae bacterium]
MRETNLRRRVELLLLFIVAGLSVIISILDTAGLLDGVQWIAQRIPALILLCVGFIASYLILERRGKLDEIALMVDERSTAILKTIGVEVNEYNTSEEYLDAIAQRVIKAKRIDNVNWVDEGEVQFRWSQSDQEAAARAFSLVKKVIHNPKVAWRDIYIFFPNNPHRFEYAKTTVLDKRVTGYSAAYFNTPPPEAVPQIGAFIIVDSGEQDAEVFVSSHDSTIWLNIKHPTVVRYFANYYESLWKKAIKLKVGSTIDNQLFQQLEVQFAGKNQVVTESSEATR